MISVYRGDTFDFTFTAPEGVSFEAGSTVKVGVRSTEDGAGYSLVKEIPITLSSSEVNCIFEPSATAKLMPSDELDLIGEAYILEVEITSSKGVVTTSFQEEIEVKRDYVYD